jgi:hypothetical protein
MNHSRSYPCVLCSRAFNSPDCDSKSTWSPRYITLQLELLIRPNGMHISSWIRCEAYWRWLVLVLLVPTSAYLSSMRGKREAKSCSGQTFADWQPSLAMPSTFLSEFPTRSKFTVTGTALDPASKEKATPAPSVGSNETRDYSGYLTKRPYAFSGPL